MDRSRSRTRSAGPPYAPVSAPTPLSGVSRHLVWNATSIQDEGPLLPPTSFAKASQPYHAAVLSQGSYTWIHSLDSSSGTKKTTVLHAASLIFLFSFLFGFPSFPSFVTFPFYNSLWLILRSISLPLALNMTKRDSFTANLASS